MPTALAAEALSITPGVPLTTDEMVDAVWVRLDAKQVDEQGTVVIDDQWPYEQVVQWLNEAQDLYWQWIVTSGEGEGEDVTYLDLRPNVDTYQLPADTLKVAQVERKRGEVWIPIRYNRNPYRASPDGTAPLQPCEETTYRFTGGYQLVVNPVPAEDEYQALRVRRLKVPTPIMAGKTRPVRDFLSVWNWLLILSATCDALGGKDRGDASYYQGKLAKFEAAFKDFLDVRSEDVQESVSFSEVLGYGEMF